MAANGIRMRINAEVLRQRQTPILINDLTTHYIATDLSPEGGWHSVASRTNYGHFLKKWIRPQWGATTLRSVRTLAVEHWLRTLKVESGDAMADSTKAKLRSLMSVVFNHAIRCEWLE